MAHSPQEPTGPQPWTPSGGGVPTGPQPWEPPQQTPMPQPPMPQPPVPQAPAPQPPVPQAPAPHEPQAWTPPGEQPGEPRDWQPTAAPAGPQPYGAGAGSAPPRQPMNRKTKRRIIGWSLAVLILGLLIAAAIVAISLVNQSRDPAGQVRDYLSLLEDGKAEQAGELVDPELGKGAALLTDDVLGSASERIEVRSVETLDRDGSGARVLAKLSLGGESFEHTFTVSPGPKELLVLDTWEFDEPLLAEVELSFSTPTDLDGVPLSVRFGAGEVGMPAPEEADGAFRSVRTVTVYPGVYDVEALGTAYFDSTATEVLAVPDPEEVSGEAGAASVELQPNDALAEEILGQAALYADGCVTVDGNSAVRSNMDPACPGITQNTRLESLEVTKRASDVALSYSDGGYWFRTDEFEFEVKSNRAGSTAQQGGYSLEGDIEWVDGEPVISDAEFR